MISQRLHDFCIDMGITPKYVMRYSKGFLYQIDDRTIWATNGDDGDTYWCLPHPYSSGDLYDLVNMLDTRDVLALFKKHKDKGIKKTEKSKVYVLFAGRIDPYETAPRHVVGVYAFTEVANAKMNDLIARAGETEMTDGESRLESTAWEGDGEWGVNLTRKGWGGLSYGYTFYILERELPPCDFGL